MGLQTKNEAIAARRLESLEMSNADEHAVRAPDATAGLDELLESLRAGLAELEREVAAQAEVIAELRTEVQRLEAIALRAEASAVEPDAAGHEPSGG